jgi:hypothetical protein
MRRRSTSPTFDRAFPRVETTVLEGVRLVETSEGRLGLALRPMSGDRFGKKKVGTEGVLESFVGLADAEEPEAILGFAERWGPLGLCRFHRLPASHAVGGPIPDRSALLQCTPVVTSGGVEPLDAWIWWARCARDLLGSAADLHQGRATHAADWPDVLSGPPKRLAPGSNKDWRPVDGARQSLGSSTRTKGRKARRNELESGAAWAVLAITLQAWTEWAGLTLALRPLASGGVGAEFRSADYLLPRGNSSFVPGIFPFLAREIVTTALKYDGLAFCDGCGGAYSPSRRPRADRRHFCEACREAGIPARLRKRDERARKAKQ